MKSKSLLYILIPTVMCFCGSGNGELPDIKGLDIEVPVKLPDAYQEVWTPDKIAIDSESDREIPSDGNPDTEIDSESDSGEAEPVDIIIDIDAVIIKDIIEIKDQVSDYTGDFSQDQKIDTPSDQGLSCTEVSCPKGYFCSSAGCTPCTDDDPAHCGSGCLKCGEIVPYCVNGMCVCKDDLNCGKVKFCNQQGKCESCMNDQHCGPECLPCTGDTPYCKAGEKCVGCFKDGDCTEGNFCNGTICTPCTDNDPLHCGSECLACGDYFKCEAGICVICDKPEYCGKDCKQCPQEKPFCYPANHECAECIDNTACALQYHCDNGTCVPDCSAQGCENDDKPDAKKCDTAKIIGRKSAKAGYTKNGDTTGSSNSDDLYPSIFNPGPEKCWDANKGNFYRIYLIKGEILNAKLTPSNYDAMLKLYIGTKCNKGGDNPVDCYENGSGKPDQITNYTATADGWYTIVVDGRTSYDPDYGPYKIEVSLACKQSDCCCL